MYHLELFTVSHLHFMIKRYWTNILVRSTLQSYYITILQVLLTRLQNSKTEVFNSRFVRLYHFISAKDDKGLGADFFINTTEQLQAG